MIRCKQCCHDKLLRDYLDLSQHRGWRALYCNGCASENMASWARTSLLAFSVTQVREVPA
jgi:hypothetical protein